MPKPKQSKSSIKQSSSISVLSTSDGSDEENNAEGQLRRKSKEKRSTIKRQQPRKSSSLELQKQPKRSSSSDLASKSHGKQLKSDEVSRTSSTGSKDLKVRKSSETSKGAVSTKSKRSPHPSKGSKKKRKSHKRAAPCRSSSQPKVLVKSSGEKSKLEAKSSSGKTSTKATLKKSKYKKITPIKSLRMPTLKSSKKIAVIRSNNNKTPADRSKKRQPQARNVRTPAKYSKNRRAVSQPTKFKLKSKSKYIPALMRSLDMKTYKSIKGLKKKIRFHVPKTEKEKERYARAMRTLDKRQQMVVKQSTTENVMSSERFLDTSMVEKLNNLHSLLENMMVKINNINFSKEQQTQRLRKKTKSTTKEREKSVDSQEKEQSLEKAIVKSEKSLSDSVKRSKIDNTPLTNDEMEDLNDALSDLNTSINTLQNSYGSIIKSLVSMQNRRKKKTTPSKRPMLPSVQSPPKKDYDKDQITLEDIADRAKIINYKEKYHLDRFLDERQHDKVFKNLFLEVEEINFAFKRFRTFFDNEGYYQPKKYEESDFRLSRALYQDLMKVIKDIHKPVIEVLKIYNNDLLDMFRLKSSSIIEN